MALPQTKSLFLLFPLLVSPFIPTIFGENPSEFSKTIDVPEEPMRRQKLTSLHFYFHDIVSGRNATAVPVTKPPNPSSFFGVIMMMDDPLTEGPDPNSKPVGRAQGMYASAALEELGFMQAMNLYFTAGKYNGSVLTVLGRNAPMHPIREMPVIGGSGLFRFATGYALARTHWVDLKTGDAIVEYNVTVMQSSPVLVG
ncbi:uncharacterized protein A4U43_C02F6810 [Asparagus officinalis]|uniref:Dirigent protein n=1 Tax=Asparagus officinalis TaxID=4686 RepID=A0A5P1FGH2_ASPOF|nr:dirigent protein 22-like [Asparagus officinalis]ONK77466.1 uncharacterized protein A4U43_C02F6810 [Asparagus officinalis]